MPRTRQSAIGDLLLCAAVVAGAALLLVGAAGLPPPRFDPLGSAALPRSLAVLMLGFAAWIAFGALRSLSGAAPEPTRPLRAASSVRPMRGLVVFAALVAFVAALDILRVPLIPATTVFMAVVGLAVSGATVRTGAIYALFGLLLASGLSWVMSSFLYVSFG